VAPLGRGRDGGVEDADHTVEVDQQCRRPVPAP
jgi:hypothetical protein